MNQLDDQKLQRAVFAYRAAIAYANATIAKWESRDIKLRQLDEFHRTRIAWENTSYRCEKLCEYAREALLTTARSEQISSDLRTHYRRPFEVTRDRGLLRVLNLIESIHQEDEHVHRTQAHPRRQTRRRSLSQAR